MINDVVRILYFHVCDIGIKSAEMKRKLRNCLWKCMKHKIELRHYGAILVTPEKKKNMLIISYCILLYSMQYYLT